jgi:hypothetical protein
MEVHVDWVMLLIWEAFPVPLVSYMAGSMMEGSLG